MNIVPGKTSTDSKIAVSTLFPLLNTQVLSEVTCLEHLPRLCLIIPTQNSSRLLTNTLETIAMQNYPHLEVIIVDAESSDRTIEMAKSFENLSIRIYNVDRYHQYEMLNRGISLSSSHYISCIFPGDRYLSQTALLYIGRIINSASFPDLVFSGALVRDGRKEPKMLMRELSFSLLRFGKQPTALEACWFRLDSIRLLQKFSVVYKARGEFDLFCTFLLNSSMRYKQINRVLIEADLTRLSQRWIVYQMLDTYKIICHHFGWLQMIRWLFQEKDLYRLLHFCWIKIKKALTGRA